MKKILALLCSLLLAFVLGACGQIWQEESSKVPSESSGQTEESSELETSSEASIPLSDIGSSGSAESETQPVAETRQISVQANRKTIVFELNDSQAAQELYEQLPLNIEVKNYSTNEKIFYPPQELDVSDAPQANAVVGTLAYYAPWGDVVMFYGDFGSAGGLYELGQAVSGSEYISGMSGTIEIQQSER